jgi:hypothetical protein
VVRFYKRIINGQLFSVNLGKRAERREQGSGNQEIRGKGDEGIGGRFGKSLSCRPSDN